MLLLQRLAILVATALLALLPTAWLDHGPPLCPIHAVFGACPVCGSMRALGHFLHGQLGEAVRWHWNVVITGPLLLYLAGDAVVRMGLAIGKGKPTESPTLG